MTNKKVLMVLTSHAALGNTGKQTGVWAEEFVLPYYVLKDAGYEIELASPKGASVTFSPGSIKPIGENSVEIERFLADDAAQSKTNHTATTTSIDMTLFDGVFFPGGHGTMWDFPDDVGIKNIVENAFSNNKPIAAVCHGPAALVSAKRADGRSILHGKRANAFTNSEEVAVGLMDVVPFTLEETFVKAGAIFEKTDNFQPFAVRDGMLMTGQNPSSTTLVAQHFVAALSE